MVRGKHLWRRIHAPMSFQEGANIAGKLPVIDLPSGVQCSGGLFIGTAYLLPTEIAGGDERRQLILARGDGDGVFVGAAVGIRDLATPFGS